MTEAKYNHVVVETVLVPKYYSGAQSNEMGAACSTYGGEESVGFWWGNLREGKQTLGRPKRGWEDNIKMNIQEVAWGLDCIGLDQDRNRWRAVVNAVMNLWVP